MAAAEVDPTLPTHEGAWTEEAYLALPDDRRIELVDGSLLVAPTTDDRHARAVAGVRAAVEAALPGGLQVLGPVALRLSPGRILVPDLVVTARNDEPTAQEPGAGESGTPESGTPESGSAESAVRDSSVALLVIDVVGRGNGVADRWFKPQLYAGSRIPYALLVDHDEPFAVANMLIGGRYHEYALAEAGGVLRLQEPFALELALDTLTEPAADDTAAAAVDEPDADRPVPA